MTVLHDYYNTTSIFLSCYSRPRESVTEDSSEALSAARTTIGSQIGSQQPSIRLFMSVGFICSLCRKIVHHLGCKIWTVGPAGSFGTLRAIGITLGSERGQGFNKKVGYECRISHKLYLNYITL